MKEILKKLNNFRLTSTLLASGALLELVMTVLYLVFYQTSGIVVEDGVTSATVALTNAKFWGMVYFLLAFATIIVGITLIYKAIPFIFPKAKETPTKSLGWLFVAESVLLFFMTIITFVIISTEESNHFVGFLICGIISVLCIISAGLMVYPWLKCRFYCPDVSRNNSVSKKA